MQSTKMTIEHFNSIIEQYGIKNIRIKIQVHPKLNIAEQFTYQLGDFSDWKDTEITEEKYKLCEAYKITLQYKHNNCLTKEHHFFFDIISLLNTGKAFIYVQVDSEMQLIFGVFKDIAINEMEEDYIAA